MKTIRWLSVMILATSLTGSACLAQAPGYQAYAPFAPPAPLAENGTAPTPAPTPVPATGGLSDWIVYRRDCCEGKFGLVTPLYTEFYLESGVAVPVGGQTLSRELRTGWSIAGGLRALFFNESMDAAWVIDAHIMNTSESAGRRNTPFDVTLIQIGTKTQFGTGKVPGATIEDYERDMVGLGLGRDWYLWKPANAEGPIWRIGVDGGGRWGTGRVDLDQFGHLTAVVGAVYAGFHTDVEIPCGRVIWQAGMRGEWAFNFSDVLQEPSYLQEISVMFTAGIRY